MDSGYQVHYSPHRFKNSHLVRVGIEGFIFTHFNKNTMLYYLDRSSEIRKHNLVLRLITSLSEPSWEYYELSGILLSEISRFANKTAIIELTGAFIDNIYLWLVSNYLWIRWCALRLTKAFEKTKLTFIRKNKNIVLW